MAQNDALVVVPGTGYLWTGTVAATAPTAAQLATFVSAGTIPGTFTPLGHTDLDNIVTFGQDGGDTTTKGSWQTSSLRQVQTSKAVDYYTIKSLQLLDKDVLSLYFGGGTPGTGTFDVPDSATIQYRSVALVMVDGTTPLCFYSASAAIKRESALEGASDDLSKVPLRITPVKNGTNPLIRLVSAALA